jgi:hypothetical protein
MIHPGLICWYQIESIYNISHWYQIVYNIEHIISTSGLLYTYVIYIYYTYKWCIYIYIYIYYTYLYVIYIYIIIIYLHIMYIYIYTSYIIIDLLPSCVDTSMTPPALRLCCLGLLSFRRGLQGVWQVIDLAGPKKNEGIIRKRQRHGDLWGFIGI